MYHAIATGTLYYLEASSTFDQEDFNRASEFLKSARDVCQCYRRKSDSFFYSNNQPYTEIEAHAELGYAESLLELAFINIMRDEKMVTFFQSSLKIRECYSCYKLCLQILNKVQWSNPTLKKEFECGVFFGLGAFNLMISLLPQRALKILEFIGFSGDKELGLGFLKKAAAMTTCLRSPLCGLMLLMYYTYITNLLNLEKEEEQVESELLLKIWLAKYEKSALFLFFAGRHSIVSFNLTLAIECFNRSIQAQNEWRNYHHLCYWELMWCHAIQGDWKPAIDFAERLACESRWSQVSYRYLKSVFILQLLHDDKHLDPKQALAYKEQVSELM
ncbi:Tetratricopeptide repeat protein 39B, partial [Cichlidogyrus casuarinus]